MINLNDEVKDELIKLASEKNVFLEGNISKCIRTEPNTKFEEYINQVVTYLNMLNKSEVN